MMHHIDAISITPSSHFCFPRVRARKSFSRALLCLYWYSSSAHRHICAADLACSANLLFLLELLGHPMEFSDSGCAFPNQPCCGLRPQCSANASRSLDHLHIIPRPHLICFHDVPAQTAHALCSLHLACCGQPYFALVWGPCTCLHGARCASCTSPYLFFFPVYLILSTLPTTSHGSWAHLCLAYSKVGCDSSPRIPRQMGREQNGMRRTVNNLWILYPTHYILCVCGGGLTGSALASFRDATGAAAEESRTGQDGAWNSQNCTQGLQHQENPK
ncbi:hypothetical protein K438DRAFT_1086574 [Mycena galopus ATCC 62051]|nr:hypothetical protein K438DRAFT_1086574 [Mycena galopus ATCC 62051]